MHLARISFALGIAGLGLAMAAAGCSASTDQDPSSESAVVTGNGIKTVFMIVMENHNWSDIKGNKSAPILNQLLVNGAHSENYFNPPGNHPSEPNYIWLEAGQNFGVDNDNEPSDNSQLTSQHLVAQLNKAGISWKAYQEGIRGNECPVESDGKYKAKHNPFMFFDDVTGGGDKSWKNCISHVRPYSELARDLQQNTVARYNFITPDICNDMHGDPFLCGLFYNDVRTGDEWLSDAVVNIVNSRAYKEGGALFITWDESEDNDKDVPIGMIVMSPFAKRGHASHIYTTHSSTLRTMQEIFNVRPFLGAAATANDLSDMFTVPLTPAR